jgi:hypothetical protein
MLSSLICVLTSRSKYFLVIAIGAANILPCFGQDKPRELTEWSATWTPFVSEGGRFRVQLPEKPKLEILTYESGKSRVTHNIFTVEKGPYIWVVDYADLPAEIDISNPVKFFNESRDELLQEVNGTLQKQKPIDLQGHVGLDMSLQIRGGEARVRLFLVNHRLYQLLVTRLDLLSKSTEPLDKFLDSFKIIDGEGGLAIVNAVFLRKHS